MPHGNKSGMDNTKQQSTQNYELHELHEDGGHRIDNSFNVHRQNNRMTGETEGRRRNGNFDVHRQNNRMTGGDRGTQKERKF